MAALGADDRLPRGVHDLLDAPYETYRLLEDGAVGLAAANMLGSMAAGLFAVYLGVVAGRAL